MKYPKHIYDPIRYEVASSIISHELKKIFGDFSEKEYKKLSDQVYGWGINPKKYSLSKEPRDFWNGVEGIMTGFRIKGVVKFITAENVTWTKRDIETKDLIFVTDHFFINDEKIPTLYKSAGSILEWLREKNYTNKALEKVQKSFSKGVPRSNDPIYCKEDKEGKIYIHDGNGRVLLALLEEKKTVPAYVGKLEGEKPTNYWISTILLVRYSQLHKEKVIPKAVYKKIMAEMFKVSEAAKVEYEERVPDEKELKQELLSSTPRA